MSVRKSGGRNARIERLESRQLLAGDVFVNVVEGNLIVEGDAESNQVAITAGAVPGSYVVRGLDGTHIIDGTSDPATPANEVVVTGVTQGARIALGAGDDRLVLANASFQGGVSIRMGEGNDNVAIGLRPLPVPTADALEPAAPGTVRIGGPLSIGTGGGNDRVHVDQAGIGGQLVIETGLGDDAVRLGHQAPAPVEAAAAVAETDPHDVRPVLRVLRGVDINLGAGQDELAADAVMAAHGMNVNAGEGSDAVHMNHIWSGGPLSVLGGAGDGADNIDLAHVRAGTATIVTGAGNDRVRILDSAFRVLAVALESGDDTLAIGGTDAQWAFLFGGEGGDTLVNRGGNRFGHRFVYGFESITNPAPEPAVVV